MFAFPFWACFCLTLATPAAAGAPIFGLSARLASIYAKGAVSKCCQAYDKTLSLLRSVSKTKKKLEINAAAVATQRLCLARG